jgi:hypothetical protein
MRQVILYIDQVTTRKLLDVQAEILHLTIQYDPTEFKIKGEDSATMQPFSASSDQSLTQEKKKSVL